MTDRVDKLEKDVAVLKGLGWATLIITTAGLALRIWQIARPPGTGPSGNSNAVHIGGTAPAASDSRKIFLSTADVAAREKIAERTLLEWIEQGRISPAPVKSARAWIIAADYRILPQTAAISRPPP